MHTLIDQRPDMTSHRRDHGFRSLPSETYVPHTMPAVLGTFDMVALFVMAVFWISNVTGIATGGAAALTYWLLCIVAFFVPCILVMTQLGLLFPHEGSLYNWTYKALGRFWSFFVGLCVWLPGVLSLVSAADVIVNCLQTLNPAWLPQAWQQGLVIIGVTLLTGVISLQRTRTVQHLINVTVVFIGFAVVCIACAAGVWLLRGHASATTFGDLRGWAINANPQSSNLPLLGTVLMLALSEQEPMLVAEQQFTPSGVCLLQPLLETFPHYCLYEHLLASFTGTTVNEQAIEQCRVRLRHVEETPEWDVTLRSVRNVLSRVRLKLQGSLSIDIHSLLQLGYVLIPVRR